MIEISETEFDVFYTLDNRTKHHKVLVGDICDYNYRIGLVCRHCLLVTLKKGFYSLNNINISSRWSRESQIKEISHFPSIIIESIPILQW